MEQSIRDLVAMWQNEPNPKKKQQMKSVLEITIKRLEGMRV